MRLWILTRTQLRVGMNGVYGLDYVAVKQTAKIYGINLAPGVMDKIRALEYDMLEEASRKNG